ncbi:MAG: NB-ARC domain-containing protein, partial [Ktedonobacterales bacterium]
MLDLLRAWGMALGVPPNDLRRLATPEDFAPLLHDAAGSRRMLVVIDDVWRLDDALAFLVGGPACAYLLTTRSPQIAMRFAHAEALRVPELTEDDGIRLVAKMVPAAVRDGTDDVRAIVRAVGGLPLALALMGRFLRVESHGGGERRLRAAINRLCSAGQRLRLEESLAPLERPPSLAPGAPLSLRAAIKSSDEQLTANSRAALRALAMLPPKPNTFSEEAALAITNADTAAVDALVDAGLLEVAAPGQYALHQTVADYARLVPY